jgi:ATP-dependent DNA helicase RecG
MQGFLIMLDQSVQYLKGVGPGRSKLLKRLGIIAIRDLLNYLPREYEDRRCITKIGLLSHGQKSTIAGKVEAAESINLSRNLAVFKVAISDGTGIAFGLFYRKFNPYHAHDTFATYRKIFAPGCLVTLYGQCEFNFKEKQIKVEEFESTGQESTGFGRIVPIYTLTQGVSQKWLRELIHSALGTYSAEWPDVLPENLRHQQNMIASDDALREIHFPNDFSAAERARQRLAFDEYFLLETALSFARSSNKEQVKSQQYSVKRSLLTPFREKLSFEFTQAQKRVINEIFTDMQKSKPMNRLLLGDVGSGKTIVALSAILLAIENGYQAVLLAPTEILAEQHFLTIREKLSGLPVQVGLLTSRRSARRKERQELMQNVASGHINLLIGTHAILEKDISFRNLSLIVIDEQHRFGVLQRATMQEKSASPDVLLMTATPIPRTLALTLYGDMDVSTIDQLPPGRKVIETMHLPELPAYEKVKEEIRKGHQAYIVYPLVEESDKVELKAAVKEAGQLSQTVFRDVSVGLLHGQMSGEDKQKTMLDFREGKFDVLIATTVIEVGIDVPNATVMVIEHADRFGLATLHQLRGRVGRGGDTSYCVLLGSPKTEEASKRIKIMLSTNNGFTIAEEDLSLRGPGEFIGTAQHGMPELRAGNLITDTRIIEQARDLSREIVAYDPSLQCPDYRVLKNELYRAYKGRMGLLRIG